MLARLLAQARGEPIQVVDSVFTDVPVEAWYANEVGYLENLGVVLGRGGGLFAPEEPITGGEFATLAERFCAAVGGQATPIAEFDPDNPITRAEGVVALNRILGRKPDYRYITEHLHQLNTFTDVDPGHWAWYDILEAANDHIA